MAHFISDITTAKTHLLIQTNIKQVCLAQSSTLICKLNEFCIYTWIYNTLLFHAFPHAKAHFSFLKKDHII